ncbi:phosphatase PAP2 family protein [Streptomyces sp. NPDC058877]|uniref:phosphatase PAP2 family protein n=1 Tax=unclassified Streptomyces TaxID=2593676 RepID=UPI0036C4A73B
MPAAPPRGALLAGTLCLLFALTVGIAASGGAPYLQSVDDLWMHRMRGSHHGGAATLADALDTLGGPLGLVVPLTVAGCLAIYGRWRSALFFFSTAVGANIIVILPLKQLVDRPRPPEPWVLVSGGSFPSGQVFTITTLVLAAGVTLFPSVARKAWWAFSAVVVAATMWSRTWLHAQWLSDTVAGAAAGAGVTLLLWRAFAPTLKEEARRAATDRLWE